MPGQILIVDPVITTRVVLKAQLTAEFYTVDLAGDIESARGILAKSPPDAVILRYEIEEGFGFSTCKELKGNPLLSHIPILLLCNNLEDMFWNTAFQIGVEEIVPISPNYELLHARLAMLIRKKEAVEEIRVRQRTYADIGFAEESLSFPPFPLPLTIGCADAKQLIPAGKSDVLDRLLRRDFPGLEWTDNTGKPCEIQVIDERQLGQHQALQRLCELHSASSQSPAKSLYVSCQSNNLANTRATELGAADYIVAPYATAELALRLRRLGWLRHLEIQAQQQENNRLKQALCDPLTGLYNRRYALHYLENLLHKAKSDLRSVTVMMLDIDNFKAVNDKFGHQTGDRVISETARRLAENLRNADLVARVGGEEFLVVLTDTPDHQAYSIAERMRRKIHSLPFPVGESLVPLNVSISIGVAFASVGRRSSSEMIQRADRALYQSKDRGRNVVTFLADAA
ncbi:MAG: diguanylate cyclase [Rhodobacteraceae bacterium]|nr:diguanylate cyclase [Paracoccaceae bacterium]